jgi:hypothetical protein
MCSNKSSGTLSLTPAVHWSRQPLRLLFSTVLGDPPLPGFVSAPSPAAAAQFRVGL